MIDLKLIKINDCIFEVRFKTEYSSKIGTIERIDGFYYFIPKRKDLSAFNEDLLESIAKELRIINKELNDSLDEYFKNDSIN